MKKISWQEFISKRFILTLFVMFVSLVGGGVVAYFKPGLWLGWSLIGIGVLSFVIICVRQRQELKIQIGNVRDDRVAPKGKVETKASSYGFWDWMVVCGVMLFILGVACVGAAAIVYSALGEDMALKVIEIACFVVVGGILIGILGGIMMCSKHD